MTTWPELLRSQLDIPYLLPTDDAVPFGVRPVPGDTWEVHGLVEENGVWRLTAHTGRGLEATYTFRFFPDTSAVEVEGEVTNRGREAVTEITELLTLDSALRFSPEFGLGRLRTMKGIVFPPTSFPPNDFQLVDREFLPSVTSAIAVASARTGRPSADNVPVAILGNDADSAGLAFFLEWSGMWSMTFAPVPLDEAERERNLGLKLGLWGGIQIGACGLWLDLQPGETLPLPRLLITSYRGDLEEGGNSLRRHIRRHVMPTIGGEEVLPPTSFNQWFAFENEFSDSLMRPAVDASAEAGLEYFCVDGGWFGGGFREGIGNWEGPDPAKFPDGIEPFADYVRGKGMKYGTWFEPEWAHTTSELYRQHPDWFWDTPDWPAARRYATGVLEYRPGYLKKQHEYALMNFGLPEVRAWWVERISRAYTEWGVRWIRWDYNQNPRANWDDVPDGQIGWRQIQHVRGLYATLDEILVACPELFIEQCASGGYRIELGMMRRGHSFWMNDVVDQSDVVRAFQHGLMTVVPGNFPNVNLCQPRHDFTDYDFLSHGVGPFGYSGRLWEAPKADFENFANAVSRFKGYRHLLLGDYSRPTGQPMSAHEYARVEFSDGGESVAIEFNHDGPRSARIETGA